MKSIKSALLAASAAACCSMFVQVVDASQIAVRVSEPRGDKINLIDSESGATKKLFSASNIVKVAQSNDGLKVAVLTRKRVSRSRNRMKVFVVDATTGIKREIWRFKVNSKFDSGWGDTTNIRWGLDNKTVWIHRVNSWSSPREVESAVKQPQIKVKSLILRCVADVGCKTVRKKRLESRSVARIYHEIFALSARNSPGIYGTTISRLNKGLESMIMGTSRLNGAEENSSFCKTSTSRMLKESGQKISWVGGTQKIAAQVLSSSAISQLFSFENSSLPTLAVADGELLTDEPEADAVVANVECSKRMLAFDFKSSLKLPRIRVVNAGGARSVSLPSEISGSQISVVQDGHGGAYMLSSVAKRPQTVSVRKCKRQNNVWFECLWDEVDELTPDSSSPHTVYHYKPGASTLVAAGTLTASQHKLLDANRVVDIQPTDKVGELIIIRGGKVYKTTIGQNSVSVLGFGTRGDDYY